MLLRADNLNIAKPNPSLLVRGLNALTMELWANDPNVGFRSSSRAGWEWMCIPHGRQRYSYVSTFEPKQRTWSMDFRQRQPPVRLVLRDPKLRPLQQGAPQPEAFVNDNLDYNLRCASGWWRGTTMQVVHGPRGV